MKLPTPHKILIVHQGAELYGSDQMLQCMLMALRQHNQSHVTVHIPTTGPLIERIKPYTDDIIIKPISILRLNSLKSLKWLNLKQFAVNLRTAWQQLKRHDMVILNTTVILSYMLLLPFYRGQKYIYVHELTLGFMRLVFNLMLFLTGAELICNSQVTADAYSLIPSRRKHLLYNISLRQTTATEKQMADKMHILLIGRISRRKGQHILLDALQYLPPEKLQRLDVRIVGDMYDPRNPYLQRLKDQIARENLSDVVSFFPFDHDPAHFYQWADLVVIPSTLPESFGLVALEALQHGRAILANKSGAMLEIITHGQNGYLAKPNSPADLANGIVYYLNNPEKLPLHGQNGLMQAKQRFDIIAYNTRLSDILNLKQAA
ncbi:MAG TPA: glycosyltransferase family 4 protein [Alphaproteobacteria bacterium]